MKQSKWMAATLMMVMLVCGMIQMRPLAVTQKSAAGLVQHCKEQLDMLYWYGTFGQEPTLDLLNQKRKQYPMQMTATRYDYAKKKHVGANKRVYDCVGLIKSYWMQATPTASPKYASVYDKSANEIYLLCGTKGPIKTLQEIPGILVFYSDSSGSKMGHVGVYAGGGQVIEARGFEYGVVQTSLRTRPWTHWGKLNWLAYEPYVGQRVIVKKDAIEYYPGKAMAKWVREQKFTVSQIDRNGQPVYYGGKRCVFLKEINTWCATEYLKYG